MNRVKKSDRIEVRTSPEVKQPLQEADRRRFVLDEAQWKAFEQALDRPVQHKPELRRLLTEPGVLDSQEAGA